MAKSTKIIAALGVAGMLGTIALPTFAAETRTMTDTLEVVINPVCGFETNSYEGSGWEATPTGTIKEDTAISNKLSGTVANGGSVSGSHSMKVVCNQHDGFSVKVTNPEALSDATTSKAIAYNNAAAAGTEGYSVAIALTTDGGASLNNDASTGIVNSEGKLKGANTAATAIIKNAGSTADTSFTVSYMIGTSSTTSAGTYTGDVVYTLVPGVNN